MIFLSIYIVLSQNGEEMVHYYTRTHHECIFFF